ncbi:coiled-coil domain-containing protein [Myroides odoratus]|uniref:coiled-coil domain-containing protein n=1 Tax=Myroides odoratus TaxID=256 RepID=UPI000765A6B5|nr:hypothetical protein [Myroides odoratus]
MDDVKNSFNEIKEYTMDRLKMPIFFYYFVILLVWNWDIILFIWKSNYPIEYVIKIIKQNGFEPNRYLYPLIIAAAGNFVFPFIMLVIELSLSKITKKRNETALDIELQKAEKEFEVQRKRTGAVSLKDLQDQIDSLNKEKDDLSGQIVLNKMSLEQVNKKIPELEKKLQKEQAEKDKFKQDVIKFTRHVDYNNLDEEINSFKTEVKRFEDNYINIIEVFDFLKKIFNEENSPLAMNMKLDPLFSILDESNKFLKEYQSGQVTRIKLLPYGIKFLYWLYGYSDEYKGVLNVYNHLRNKGILSDFMQKGLDMLNNKNTLYQDSNVNQFLQLGLINHKGNLINSDRKRYELTDLGMAILKYAQLNYNENL